MRALARLSQVFRRATQLGVVAFVVWTALGGPWRNFKVAHNNARLVGLMEGHTWATLYDLNERALSLWGEPLRASFDFLGMPWAATVFGVATADPLFVLAHVLSTRHVSPSLMLGVATPLALAAVLGKVFCSHLCPMRLGFELGALVRGGLLRLGFDLPHLRSSARFGGWILLGGAVGTLFSGAALWLFVLPYVGVSAAIFLFVTAGTTGGLAVVPAFWLTVDALLAPGFFCHNLCPQGFLLEIAGRFSLLRLKKRGETPCPETCHACEQVCPYALSPRQETHRPACDNCGTCVRVCPQRKLTRKLALPIVMGLLCLLAPATAFAHHNKGLPHYGYFENYPQVPTEENVVIKGHWEMGTVAFNFQGYDRRSADTPNDVKFFTYLYDLEADRNYVGAVDFEIRLGDRVVSRFARESVDEETIYSTRETLPESGDYLLVAIPRDVPQRVEIALPFHVSLGEAKVSWGLVGAIGLPVLALFVLALLGRTRKGRARRMKAQAGALGALALLSSGVARAQPAPPCTDGSGGVLTYTTLDGTLMTVMRGIPPWLFLIAVAAVIVVSFLVVERFGSQPSDKRVNLIKKRRLYEVVRSRWFQAVPQLVALGVFGVVVYTGLFGSPIRNLAPVLVWTLWWGGLIFAVALLGPAFCFVCPWDALANLVSRLSLTRRTESLSFGLRPPAWLRTVWPAIVLFALLTWAELGLGITTDPRGTAYLGLGMAALAVGTALLFEKKTFCRYLCPVGRIQGIYSNFSPIELRPRNPRACEKCTTEDCLNGNERGYPCPTGLSLKVIQDSSYCIGCTECVKSCNKHNVALNLRPFATDLSKIGRPRRDEVWLAVSLLALTLFHGLTMTTAWETFAPGQPSLLKWMHTRLGTPQTLSFTLGMIAAVTLPILLYWVSCALGARLTRGSGVRAGTLFSAYTFSLLPIALFYHLAHNSMHVLMEGGHVLPLLSDPLGRGTNYFGTASVHVGAVLGETPLAMFQVGLILVGHVFGVVVAHRISRRLYADPKQARKSLIPMTAMMVLLSVAALSLMVLDMNMRTGRM